MLFPHHTELLRDITCKFIGITIMEIYCFNESKTAIVSAFLVVGNCPPPETVSQKRHGKQQEMFFVDHNLDQGLYELMNCFDV